MYKIYQTFLLILLVVSLVIPYKTFALNKEQRFEIERRFWYDETDTGCNTQGSGNAGTGDFSGGSNAQIAFNFLVSKGLTKEQAAGIVGNMQLESGVNPRAVNSNGGATGIIQWLGGRKDALFAYGRANNTDPLTLELQLRFLWEEANGAESSAFNQFKTETANDQGAEGAAHAAERFDVLYERSEGTTIPQRQQYARQAYNAFASQVTEQPGAGTPNPSTPTTPTDSDAVDPCAGANGSGDSGVGGIDKFPLNTNKRVIQAGAGGQHWCYEATTSCHGEYNAADIPAPTGTPVVAAKSGKVATVNNISSGANLSILGSDGKYVYYYTHMGYGSVTVTEGQDVGAGDTIGRVGTAGEAEDTIPHLHFDMLPGRFGTRPACSRESCPSDVRNSFIDVQPLLVQLYQGLPN